VSPCSPTGAKSSQLGPSDIICGRDFVSQTHVGNKAFRRVINAYRGRYKGTPSRSERSRIVASVAQILKRRGGRFVVASKRSGAWHEVEAHVAKQKIQQALNSRRKSSTLPWLRTADPHPAQEEDAAYHDLLAVQRAMFSTLLVQKECQPSSVR
jgi:hypothetical protein